MGRGGGGGGGSGSGGTGGSEGRSRQEGLPSPGPREAGTRELARVLETHGVGTDLPSGQGGDSEFVVPASRLLGDDGDQREWGQHVRKKPRPGTRATSAWAENWGFSP